MRKFRGFEEVFIIVECGTLFWSFLLKNGMGLSFMGQKQRLYNSGHITVQSLMREAFTASCPFILGPCSTIMSTITVCTRDFDEKSLSVQGKTHIRLDFSFFQISINLSNYTVMLLRLGCSGPQWNLRSYKD